MKKLIISIHSIKEWNIFLKNISTIKNAKENVEIIVGCEFLSRHFETTIEEVILLIKNINKEKIKCVFEWDALILENNFEKSIDLISKIPLEDLCGIRLQDQGAIHFIKTNYPWLKIQLLLENGNHNLEGLKAFEEFLGEQCSRLILSNELSKEKLFQYKKVLNSPIEILVLGKILLFFSPRKLLSPLKSNSSESKNELRNKLLKATGSSEESPHSGFPLVENSHGTMMFNVKDLYLLGQLDELQSNEIINFRVNLDSGEQFLNYHLEILKYFFEDLKEEELLIKIENPRPFIKGYYQVNKSDVLFSKLKNYRIARKDEDYIGEVIDVERDSHLAIMIKSKSFDFEKMLPLKFVTPEGKVKSMLQYKAKNSVGDSVLNANQSQIVLLPYLNGVTVRTQIYLNIA